MRGHMTTPIAGTAHAALKDYADELHASYEVWYAKAVRRMLVGYYGLQIMALLSGFAAALIAALADGEMLPRIKPWLVALPLIGSLAAAVLSFFRVYDRWQLREDGRVAFQDLAAEARRLVATAPTAAECSRLHADLRQA